MSEPQKEEEPFCIGKYGTIGEAYESSIWFNRFITALCEYYGYPTTGGECYTKKDKQMHAWAMMNIVWAVKRYQRLWIDGLDKYDIEILADSFIRAVYDLDGQDVIPPFTGEITSV